MRSSADESISSRYQAANRENVIAAGALIVGMPVGYVGASEARSNSTDAFLARGSLWA